MNTSKGRAQPAIATANGAAKNKSPAHHIHHVVEANKTQILQPSPSIPLPPTTTLIQTPAQAGNKSAAASKRGGTLKVTKESVTASFIQKPEEKKIGTGEAEPKKRGKRLIRTNLVLMELDSHSFSDRSQEAKRC